MYNTNQSDLTFSEPVTLNKGDSVINPLSTAIQGGSRVAHSQTLESNLDQNLIEYKLLLDLTVFGRDSEQNKRFVQLQIVLRGFLN